MFLINVLQILEKIDVDELLEVHRDRALFLCSSTYCICFSEQSLSFLFSSPHTIPFLSYYVTPSFCAAYPTINHPKTITSCPTDRGAADWCLVLDPLPDGWCRWRCVGGWGPFGPCCRLSRWPDLIRVFKPHQRLPGSSHPGPTGSLPGQPGHSGSTQWRSPEQTSKLFAYIWFHLPVSNSSFVLFSRWGPEFANPSSIYHTV